MPALYYPYIHIRSEAWLKSTLLFVPSVARIVPESYVPEDDPAISRYQQLNGMDGPMLQQVSSAAPEPYRAQMRLLEFLENHRKDIIKKYKRGDATGTDTYWIHDAKFSHQLLRFLERHRLAWRSVPNHPYGTRDWYALHPNLGRGVMSAIGLSVAISEGLDIVTDDGDSHENLLAQNEQAIFERLLAHNASDSQATASGGRQELHQLVIALSGIHLDAISPEDIATLQHSKHLPKFQKLIRDRSPMPSGGNLLDYRRELQWQAQEIVESWNEARSSLAVLTRLPKSEAVDLAKLGFAAAIVGPSLELAVTAGIGIAVSTGVEAWNAYRNQGPFQFLSEIERKQSYVVRLSRPLGTLD